VVVINLVLLRRALHPLEALTALARRVDLTRPGQRVPVGQYQSEVSELATTFNEMLSRLENERRDATRRVLAAQEGERLRIAQELHDEVGQTLTAVLLQLGRSARHADPKLGAELLETQETARASLEDVRRISRELRPEALDDLGLASALVALTERFAQGGGLTVRHQLDRELPPLSEEAELVIYRVAQEALTNVVRHSGTGQAELSLTHVNGRLVLRVVDDGRGFDPQRAEGGGLRGMRERAVLVGAQLGVSRGPRGGAEVRLTVPLEEQGE
jgi:two-component system sensor histidine kinase UhpB